MNKATVEVVSPHIIYSGSSSLGIENVDAGEFTGEFNAEGNKYRYYDDVVDGDSLDLSISTLKTKGAICRVRVKGGLVGDIPVSWNKKGDEYTESEGQFNILVLMYVSDSDITLINSVIEIPDTEAPSVPENLESSNITGNSLSLDWDESTDNVIVEGYEVYQDDVLLGTTATNTYNVGSLEAETEYDFKVRAYDANGNFSVFSDVLTETTDEEGFDPNLLAHWSAADDSSITKDGSNLVSQWNDLSGNGEHLTESTDKPEHDAANDKMIFDGDGTTTFNALSKVISSFQFQHTDSFSILIKGLVFDVGGGASQNVLNNKVDGGATHGWSVNSSGDGNTLFVTLRGALNQRSAEWTLVGGFIDGEPRDVIFTHDGTNYRIYDTSNTEIDVSNTINPGASTYDTASFKIGREQPDDAFRSFKGSIQEVKVWDKVLNSAERLSQLA